MGDTIIKKRRGYNKQISPKEAIEEITELKQRLSYLENNTVIKEERSLLNISKEVTFRPEVNQGKIKCFTIFHKCWVVGTLYWHEFPNFRVNNAHYKIEWIQESIRILWDGMGR